METTFEQFKHEWLQSVKEGAPTTVQLGNRFAHKIITQWLDANPDTDDIVYCDGSGDGGIDVAYLNRREASESGEGEVQAGGDSWYLVQSKHGSAFRGSKTILEEGQKVIDTLDGKRSRLSSLAEGVLSRVVSFRQNASDYDRIFLVFATEDSLTDEQRRALEDIKAMGRNRLGPIFDVEAVSVETLFKRLQEEGNDEGKLRIRLSANLVPSGPNLLVGSTPLIRLFDFLKDYRKQTQDLDQLYERNVRRFLGGRGKVNKAMQSTLRERPEQFGLFNNGITITVANYSPSETGYDLVEPYVVNGCQTTRTIWEVCQQKLEAGGTGTNEALEEWKKRFLEGVVVTKIVKVGAVGEALLQEITRYTNSQNAVREKDFLTLTSNFRDWARQMDVQHDVYLEVQRGGWDSRRALQKQRPDIKQFEHATNAFDLLKVFGAGWLSEAGTAFGRNAAFLPSGSIFKRIMNGDGESSFGIEDLYAAYRLQQASQEFNFGRNAEKQSRRLSKFLFYTTAVELLKDVLIRAGLRTGTQDLTRALTALFSSGGEEAAKLLMENSINLIDDYFTQGTDDSVHNEPRFVNDFNGDLNGFLKWEGVGKSEENTPRYRSLIADYRKLMGRAKPGERTDREIILGVVKSKGATA